MPKKYSLNNLKRVLLFSASLMWLFSSPVFAFSLIANSHKSSKMSSTMSQLVFPFTFSSSPSKNVASTATTTVESFSPSPLSSTSILSSITNDIESSVIIKRLKRITSATQTTTTTTTTTSTTTTKKIYLEDEIMSNPDYTNSNNNNNNNNNDDDDDEDDNEDYSEYDETNNEENECKTRKETVSYDLGACGRVTLETNTCAGLCASSEQILPSMGLKRRTCFACKPHRYIIKSYPIRCTDGTKRMLKLKTIEACSCFKHSEKDLPF